MSIDCPAYIFGLDVYGLTSTYIFGYVFGYKSIKIAFRQTRIKAYLHVGPISH